MNPEKKHTRSFSEGKLQTNEKLETKSLEEPFHDSTESTATPLRVGMKILKQLAPSNQEKLDGLGSPVLPTISLVLEPPTKAEEVATVTEEPKDSKVLLPHKSRSRDVKTATGLPVKTDVEDEIVEPSEEKFQNLKPEEETIEGFGMASEPHLKPGTGFGTDSKASSLLEPDSEVKLQISHIANDVSEIRLQISPIKGESAGELSEIRLQISNIDEEGISKEKSEIKLQISHTDDDVTAASKQLSMVGILKGMSCSSSGNQDGKDLSAHSQLQVQSTLSSFVDSTSQLQMPRSTPALNRRSITFNIPSPKEGASSKATSDSSKEYDVNKFPTTLEEPLCSKIVSKCSTDSSTPSTTPSGLPASVDDRQQNGSNSAVIVDQLLLPRSFKEAKEPARDHGKVHSSDDSKVDYLTPHYHHNQRLIKSEEDVRHFSRRESMRLTSSVNYQHKAGATALYPDVQSPYNFTFPQRSASGSSGRVSRVFKALRLLDEEGSKMERRDTQVSFGTVETVNYATESDEGLSQGTSDSRFLSREDIFKFNNAEELEQIRARARSWVAKSKLASGGPGVQKTRPLIEIPRALKSEIWKEACPIVEKMYEFYQSALGANDSLTQGALDHLEKNTDRFQRKL